MNKFKAGDRVKYIADEYERMIGESIGEFDLANNNLFSGGNKEFHSSHYESKTIEPIEFIMENDLDFNTGNIIKYAFRVGNKKGQEVSDIKKIIDYALLLSFQKQIPITQEEVVELINYRFNWKEERKL